MFRNIWEKLCKDLFYTCMVGTLSIASVMFSPKSEFPHQGFLCIWGGCPHKTVSERRSWYRRHSSDLGQIWILAAVVPKIEEIKILVIANHIYRKAFWNWAWSGVVEIWEIAGLREQSSLPSTAMRGQQSCRSGRLGTGAPPARGRSALLSMLKKYCK